MPLFDPERSSLSYLLDACFHDEPQFGEVVFTEVGTGAGAGAATTGWTGTLVDTADTGTAATPGALGAEDAEGPSGMVTPATELTAPTTG